MRDVLKDGEFRKLLRDKQKYEMFSWIIPLISILSLIIILYLTSKSNLTEFTVVVLVLLIFLIVGGYLFDNKITIKIHESYAQLNQYFQDIIVPQLLVKDNSTIVFHKDEILDRDLIDDIELFDNYTDYKSQYTYTGKMDNHQFHFTEVMFENLVGFNTDGKKRFNDKVYNDVNYHWYTVTLNKTYPIDALYLVSKFENFDNRLIKEFEKFDFKHYRINPDYDIELYLKDVLQYEEFIVKDIIRIINSDIVVGNSALAVFIKKNQLHIIIEEFDDLINLTHSNKIVVDNLLKDYYDEQKLVKLLVNTFD